MSQENMHCSIYSGIHDLPSRAPKKKTFVEVIYSGGSDKGTPLEQERSVHN